MFYCIFTVFDEKYNKRILEKQFENEIDITDEYNTLREIYKYVFIEQAGHIREDGKRIPCNVIIDDVIKIV